MSATLRVVVFDVGETLVDETRYWALWANWLGVTPASLLGARDTAILRREHHRRAFAAVAPRADPDAIQRRREAAGERFVLGPEDLYPDAAGCVAAVRALGLRVGFASNAPFMNAGIAALLGSPGDILPATDDPPAEKPDPAFFAHVAARAGCAPAAIAYVGDRLDTDILPARAAGMTAIFLARGPWGSVHATWPEAAQAHARIDNLLDLPGRISALRASASSA